MRKRIRAIAHKKGSKIRKKLPFQDVCFYFNGTIFLIFAHTYTHAGVQKVIGQFASVSW